LPCPRSRAVSAVWLFGVFLIALTQPALSASRSSTPAEFDAQLAQTRAVIAAVSDPLTTEDRVALQAEADAWRSIDSVTATDGSVLPLDTEPLAALLSDPDAPPKQLQGVFETVALTRATWLGNGHTEADLATLAQILSDPKYASPNRAGWPLWVQDLLRRLLDWMRALSFSVNAPDLSQVWAIGLSALLVVLLFGAVWALRRSIVHDRLAASRRSAFEATNADDALSRADAFAAAGDYRQAVRLLYLGTLLVLDEKGALRYDRALTNREYLARLRGRPELGSALASVVDVFDRVWYGEQPLAAEAFARYAAEVSDLRGRT